MIKLKWDYYKVFIDHTIASTCFLGAYGTPCSLRHLMQEAEAILQFGMTSVWNKPSSKEMLAILEANYSRLLGLE